MPQIEPRDLDFSTEMKAYFAEVTQLLIDRHKKSPDEAESLVGRYFSIRVDPLERALVMHSDAESVAENLAGHSNDLDKADLRRTAPF